VDHNINVERFGVRLRPVRRDDAEFIFRLRRTPGLSRYIGELSPDYAAHLAWLERYFSRPGDYYFMIETSSGKPAGTISVYDIVGGEGNWGRWIILPEIPAAAASVWLIFHVAFDLLSLDAVYSNTVLDNVRTVSFHDRCGLERVRIDPGAMTIQGTTYDVIIHAARKENWPEIRERLERAALLAQRWL
jgi:hypothetical protein